ncbi:hypothetical protein HOD29_01030 [archaeon]|jgi:hypothetical protein|nr:hypothetical protein [archaeon]
MKRLSFIFLFICLIGVVSSVSITGISREDRVFTSPEFNITFDLETKEVYRLWDLDFSLQIDSSILTGTYFALSYLVLNENGEAVYSEEEVLFVEGDSFFEGDLDTRKAHQLDLDFGDYEFILRIKSGNFEQVFSDFFRVDRISALEYSLKQLFDIRMDLETSSFFDLEELEVGVVFESFGSEPTPVNLTFFIYDIFGNEVYQLERFVVVETEEVVGESFEDLEIVPGKYNLVLRTLYNVNVEDYFEQEFEYKKKFDYFPFIILVLVFIGGGYLFFREIRKGVRK